MKPGSSSSSSATKKKSWPFVFSIAVSGAIGMIIGILLTHFHYHFQAEQLQQQSPLQQQIAAAKSVVTQNIRTNNPAPITAPIVVPVTRSNTVVDGNLQATCAPLLDQFGSGNRSASSERMNSRGEIPNFLNRLGLLGEAVEVGVRDGDYSQWMLSHWNGKRYHMVDPWLEQDKKLYNDISNVSVPLLPTLFLPHYCFAKIEKSRRT